MTEPKFIGKLNADTGNPELVKIIPKFKHNQNADRHELVATGGYHDFAFYDSEDNGDSGAYVVFGPYFEGKLPSRLIGVALRLIKAEAVVT